MSIPPKFKSIFLVSAQFICIGWLALGIDITNLSFISTACILLGLALILWAIITMRRSKLRVFPQPSINATLVVSGPYHFIRHPMYTAILVGGFGLLYSSFTWHRLLAFFCLVVVLVIKLSWEEKMLVEKFPSYINYKNHTKKLLPLIF